MKTVKTDGLVLRYANYGEGNRMLTLLTPEMGLLSVSARGCRNASAKNLPASELFAAGEYVLYEKGERYTLTSFHLQQSFYAIREDFERLAHGVYWLNLAEAAAQPGEGARRLFRMMLLSLTVLCFSDVPCRALTAVFLAQFAMLSGFTPRLDACALCGRTDARLALYDVEAGGVCCAACARPEALAVSTEGLLWLREAQTKGAFALAGQRPTPMPERPDIAEEALTVLRAHVEFRLEKRIDSGRFL